MESMLASSCRLPAAVFCSTVATRRGRYEAGSADASCAVRDVGLGHEETHK
jgi:hypothetical protein